jgi:hypothetical protein
MATERRRQQLMLGVLVVVLLVAIYRMWPPTSATSAATSNRQGQARGSTGQQNAQAAGSDAPDVHLEALQSDRPKPGSAGRDLFRFKPKALPPPPPPPKGPVQPTAPVATAPPGPPPPPVLPPITLKFIGTIERPTDARKIAVLSDGRGAPIYGKEGETVLGQYRILKIGVESIEMAYADGRGRQTIRLTGQ